jgi:hypothetical protein
VCRKGLGYLINPVRSLIFCRQEEVTLTVQLNVKAIGRTKIGKAQTMIALLCPALKVMAGNL